MAIKIQQIELAEPIEGIKLLHAEGKDVWLLIRLRGEPLGWLRYSYHQLPLSGKDIAADIAKYHSYPIYEHSLRRMLENSPEVLQSEKLFEHALYNPELPSPPTLVSVLVLITEKSTTQELEACLTAIKNQDHQNIQTIGFSFASTLSNELKQVATRFEAELILGHQALKKAVEGAKGRLILITGTNGVPDKRWARGVVQAIDTPAIAGVSGPLFPLELENPAQIEFERNAKRPVWFVRYYNYDQVYSIQPETFGTPLNIAFQKAYLNEQLSKPLYDNVFGTTQLLELCYEALKKGYMLGFEPQAIVWERYPSDSKEVWTQLKQEGKERSDYLTKATREGLTSGQLFRVRVKTTLTTSRSAMQVLRSIKSKVSRTK
jgi:hypothetical protein